ncbi:acyl-CoA-binding protein [bacterium]|nr:acyl-CoA-binding protein [bacterium]NBX83772.1 acyl-CoA-binding protein [bacterium]
MTFNEAAEAIKTLSSRPSNDTLLQLYALFKQGTEGDVTGNRPGLLDPKGRAKFDAWTQKKGLSKEESQQQYIALVKTLLK